MVQEAVERRKIRLKMSLTNLMEFKKELVYKHIPYNPDVIAETVVIVFGGENESVSDKSKNQSGDTKESDS